MSKLYETFQSPYSLHKPPLVIPFYTTFISISEFVVKNIQNFFCFSGASWAEFLLWQKQLIPAPFYFKSVSLLLISVILLYLSSILSCKFAVGEETSKTETSYCLRWKLYYYFSPSHLTPENFGPPSAFCLSLIFFSFLFFGLLRPLLQICMVSITQTSQKILTKSQLSNEHLNNFFLA